MLESSQPDKLSILTYVSQFYHKFSKECPTPAARRSILPTRERSEASKDDGNNNTCIDDQDQGKREAIPHYSSSDGDFSSSSPYSSSLSSGCYQLPTESDSQDLINVEKSSFCKIEDSSPSFSQADSIAGGEEIFSRAHTPRPHTRMFQRCATQKLHSNIRREVLAQRGVVSSQNKSWQCLVRPTQ